jgi:segregation and condensation protein B
MANPDLSPKLQVEALLFSSGKTMTEEHLAALTRLDQRTVSKALQLLAREYSTRDSAITVFNDPTGWKMMVRDAYVPVVKHIVAETELSRACLETLGVIAYKYPVAIQSEVIDVRGGGAYEHMAELERLGFIRREPSGRSFLVKLTEKFFSYFDVAGGKDIREAFKNIKVPVRPVEQKTLSDMPAQANPAPVEQPETPVAEDPAPDHHAFLSDLDERIARIRTRNDETDKDETLKRKPLPGAEEQENVSTTPSEENPQNT